MIEDKKTIAFLSNFITELRKQRLDKKGKEILRTTEQVLEREIMLTNQLEDLRNERESIKSKSERIAKFHAHTPKNREETIEDLHQHTDLSKVLDMAVSLVLRDGRR